MGTQARHQARGHDPTLGGYLWLNLHLIEQLAHLHRLLGLVLQPHAKPSAALIRAACNCHKKAPADAGFVCLDFGARKFS